MEGPEPAVHASRAATTAPVRHARRRPPGYRPQHAGIRGAKAVVPPSERSGLGHDSLILTSGTLVSRVTGLLRSMVLVAAVAGVGTVADAFTIANTLPTMLFTLLASGVLQAVLMPQIMRSMRAPNAKERLDKLLTLGTSVTLIATVILLAATPLLIRLFTLSGAWQPQAVTLAIAFAYWCIPQVFFYGLFALVSNLLNARGQFGATGWAPIANNVISIAGFGMFIVLFGRADGPLNDLTYWTWGHTALLGATATLGIVAQAAILLIALKRGGYDWQLRFGARGIGLRSAGNVVLWTLGAVALDQAVVILLRNVTAAAGQRGIEAGLVVAGPAMYDNAMMLYLLPHSLVVVSLVTALAPRMTAEATSGDIDAVRKSLSFGLRSAGVFSVFSAAVLFTLAEPIMKTLFPTMRPNEVAVGAPVLRALAVGLIALGGAVMIKRMYFAFEDGKGIFLIQVVSAIVTAIVLLVVTSILNFQYWAIAAGAAFVLGTWVSVLLRVSGMRKKLRGIDGARVLRLYARATLAALLAAISGLLMTHLLSGYDVAYLHWARAFLTCVVAGTVMIGVYVAGLKLMRVRELDQALAPVMRRLAPLVHRLRSSQDRNPN